jgi:hypothetical protein
VVDQAKEKSGQLIGSANIQSDTEVIEPASDRIIIQTVMRNSKEDLMKF